MGFTYKELSRFGALRKVHKLGPYGCFLRLQSEWHAEGMTPREIADKVSFPGDFLRVLYSRMGDY